MSYDKNLVGWLSGCIDLEDDERKIVNDLSEWLEKAASLTKKQRRMAFTIARKHGLTNVTTRLWKQLKDNKK